MPPMHRFGTKRCVRPLIVNMVHVAHPANLVEYRGARWVATVPADPFQNTDMPEIIEEYLDHGAAKCLAFNRRGTLLAGA